MNIDEIQQAARAFGQQAAQSQQGYQPGEAMPGLHQDPSYQQAEQFAKAQAAQAPQQAPVQPVQQPQAPVQQQQPAPVPPAAVQPQRQWDPITDDTFSKALSVLDNTIVPNDLRSDKVQKSIDQDVTGYLGGITERLEETVQTLTKAQNAQMSAISVVLLKSLEEIDQLRSVVNDLARAPVADPKGQRYVAPTVAPINKAFPSGEPGNEGFIGGQYQAPENPQVPPQGNELTKSQINTGFGLLIQKAGQSYDENPCQATRARLDRIGVESGNFPFNGMISKSTKAEINAVLNEAGLLQVH